MFHLDRTPRSAPCVTVQDIGLSRVLAILERNMAESRRLMGDPLHQICFSLALRAENTDALFLRAVRSFDALTQALNTTHRRVITLAMPGGFSELESMVSLPLGLGQKPFMHLGLSRSAEGHWETDFLALEYALSQNSLLVLDEFDTFVRNHLRPNVVAHAAAAVLLLTPVPVVVSVTMLETEAPSLPKRPGTLLWPRVGHSLHYEERAAV